MLESGEHWVQGRSLHHVDHLPSGRIEYSPRWEIGTHCSLVEVVETSSVEWRAKHSWPQASETPAALL